MADEDLSIFLLEMGEKLEELEDALNNFGNDPEEEEVNKAFRAIHTIKGGAGFFQLDSVVQVSHQFEDILMQIRDKKLSFSKLINEVFWEATDFLKTMHEAADFKSSDSVGKIVAKFKVSQLGEPGIIVPQTEAISKEKQSEDEAKDPHSDQGERIIEENLAIKHDIFLNRQQEQISNLKPLEKKPPKQVKPEETIRVKVNLLDKLMDLTGEIVLSRNQLLEETKSSAEKSTIKDMARMISDLQQLVLQTRMQPISGTFNKFNKIVRDISREINKPINLSILGSSTELDRSILEALSDPLTHLIRNAADHGLENSEERLAVGKDSTGTITLAASYSGSHVVLSVSDDGKGIDPSKIADKAISAGLSTASEIEMMTEKDILKFIFHPGFSTADNISKLSGRGVGMDVVKASFDKLGGIIELESKMGFGTELTIHLPTTLTIMPSLIFSIDESVFALPHTELKEVIKVDQDDDNRIENVRERFFFKLREGLIPILSLDEILGEGSKLQVEHTVDRTSSMFLVLHSGNNQFGLLIDRIHHSEEIVVKPLPEFLGYLTVYAGSTILGNSDVAMVLSANGICQKCNLNNNEGKNYNTQSLADLKNIDLQEKQDLLLFKSSSLEQFALPLSMVAKVAQVKTSELQKFGNDYFLSQDGKNILIIKLETYIDLNTSDTSLENIYIILPKIENFAVGILAHRIVGTVHERLTLDKPPSITRSVLGITKIEDKITFVLDLFSLAEIVDPDTFKAVTAEVPEQFKKLLLVEDTPFFRELERSYFEAVGFEVTVASNGSECLDLLNNTKNKFDIIVSDIVMPIMDGYELVKRIRADASFKAIPVIALTSFAEEEYKEKAIESGFDGYAVKTNREAIVSAVLSFVSE